MTSVAEQVRQHASKHGVHTAMALAMLAAALAADPRPVRVPQTMRASNGRTYETEREVDAEIVDCFRNTHSPMDRCCCTNCCDFCEGD